jgi:hypothetical protein
MEIPEHLSPESKAWFAKIAADYVLGEHDLLILQSAAECWDRVQESRRILLVEGLTFVDNRKAIRPHPATAIESTNRTLFVRHIRDLHLPDPSDLVEARLNGR